jgi:fructose-bisphosphate aldolase class II
MSDARGVPEEAIRKASKMAVCKINVDTDLKMVMTAVIRQVFAEHPKEIDPMNYLGPARDAIKEMVRHKLRVLGCAGKAPECL